MLADLLYLLDQARELDDTFPRQVVLCCTRPDTRLKWALLDRISKTRFPITKYRAAGFPVEYTFRSTSGPHHRIVATIRPHVSRPAAEKDLLYEYRAVMEDFSKLPDVIKNVTRLMRPNGMSDKSKFVARDALCIDVWTPHSTNLSIVDLPPLGSAPSGEKWNEDDRTAWEIAESYLTKSTTLAVACIRTDDRAENRPLRELIKKHKQNTWKGYILGTKEMKETKIQKYRTKLVFTLMGSDTGRDLYCGGLSVKRSARRRYREVKRFGHNLREVFGLEGIRTRVKGSSGWEKLD